MQPMKFFLDTHDQRSKTFPPASRASSSPSSSRSTRRSRVRKAEIRAAHARRLRGRARLLLQHGPQRGARAARARARGPAVRYDHRGDDGHTRRSLLPAAGVGVRPEGSEFTRAGRALSSPDRARRRLSRVRLRRDVRPPLRADADARRDRLVAARAARRPVPPRIRHALLLTAQMVYVCMVYGPIAAFLVELFPTRTATRRCRSPITSGTDGRRLSAAHRDRGGHGLGLGQGDVRRGLDLHRPDLPHHRLPRDLRRGLALRPGDAVERD